jgi:hypothetical protein
LNVLRYLELTQQDNPQVAAADAQRYAALHCAARLLGVNFPLGGRVLHLRDAHYALAD